MSHKEFCISDLPSRLVSDKMWIFECVFIPRVAAFDHSFSFSAYVTFRNLWADMYDFRTAIACKGKKK